jgi:hypothetical protein
MVTFLSLFLWLMTDVHPVKVAVDPGVASVEIFLDGEGIGVATAPEWEIKCDFGNRLRPHELVAVALAGLRAAADGCPRTVVLVLGEDAVDESWHRPPAVREYLRALRVPLVVWSPVREMSSSPWGRAETVTGFGGLNQASRRLLKGLRRQWIVWVEGRHLPHEIELADNDKGIRLGE